MTENYNYLFHYLEKENITIDKNEFEIQIQSHPDYPSLLTISDTLSFFNIDNGAMRIDVSEIVLLPDCFIALLSEEVKEPQMYFIEKKGNSYFYTNDKKPIAITEMELKLRWKARLKRRRDLIYYYFSLKNC